MSNEPYFFRSTVFSERLVLERSNPVPFSKD